MGDIFPLYYATKLKTEMKMHKLEIYFVYKYDIGIYVDESPFLSKILFLPMKFNKI